MKKINQVGMSSILFAMVFVIVLSLLAVGFATLIRTDQQQVLDKTLSFQAQYAAETAINRKAAELIKTPTTADSPNCGPANSTLNLGGLSGSIAQAEVTCITWQSTTDSLEKDQLSTDPYITKLKTSESPAVPHKVTFSWASTTAKTSNYGTVATINSNLPTIDSNNVPILRLAIANSDLSNLKRMYFVPSSNGSANIAAPVDGGVYAAHCSSGTCDVSFTYSTDNSWVSMMTLGGPVHVTVQALDSSNNPLLLSGAQATIDANARSQDVTKRIRAKVPLVPQTWNPGFALSANAACKDFKVNGTNTDSASGGPVCGNQ